MTTTHEQIRAAIDGLRAACRRFERNAHLGQPVRSADVYGSTVGRIVGLGIAGDAEFGSDRYGLADAANRLLAASAQGRVDRDEVHDVLRELTARADEATGRAKASR